MRVPDHTSPSQCPTGTLKALAPRLLLPPSFARPASNSGESSAEAGGLNQSLWLQYHTVSQDYHRCFQVPRKPTTNTIPGAVGPRTPRAAQRDRTRPTSSLFIARLNPKSVGQGGHRKFWPWI